MINGTGKRKKHGSETRVSFPSNLFFFFFGEILDHLNMYDIKLCLRFRWGEKRYFMELLKTYSDSDYMLI